MQTTSANALAAWAKNVPAGHEEDAGVQPVAGVVLNVEAVHAGANELLAHTVHTRFAKRVAGAE